MATRQVIAALSWLLNQLPQGGTMKKEVTEVVTIDDLDLESPAEDFKFRVNDRDYEIDLSEAHADELENLLETLDEAKSAYEASLRDLDPFIQAAREIEPEPLMDEVLAEEEVKPKAKSNGKGKGKGSRGSRAVTDREIRQWALDSGQGVSKTGRVSKSVRDAYIEAHS